MFKIKIMMILILTWSSVIRITLLILTDRRPYWFYHIVVCTHLKFFSLFHFNDILTTMFNLFHIPAKLILRQSTWSLILAPFQRKVCMILQPAQVPPLHWYHIWFKSLVYKGLPFYQSNSSALILLVIGQVINGFSYTLFRPKHCTRLLQSGIVSSWWWLITV